MAGLGRKTWSAGEVATAANIQGYLQDQTVMKFANTAAAGSALGTAVSEGMTAYLSDTDEQVMYNGTSWFKQNGTTNAIINGAFDIWQRGTSFTNPGAAYTADRWKTQTDTNLYSVSQQAQTSAGSGFGFKLMATGANGYMNAGTQIEYTNFQHLIGQTFTISFYAKALVDNAASKTLALKPSYSTTQDASVINGGTTLAYDTFTLTTTMTRYSKTYSSTLLSGVSAKSLAINFLLNQAVAANDGIQIEGVQLEAGSVATPFKRNAPSIQAELAACQRYYWRTSNSAQYSIHGLGFANSTTNARILIKNPVTLRTSPTAVEWGNLQVSDYNTGFTPSSIVLTSAACSGEVTSLDAACTGLTQYRPYVLWNPNNTAGYIGISAEL